MCIAILSKPGTRLDKETFDRCWNINDDGAGLAYSNGREMVIVKELSSLKRFWRLYNKHRNANPDVPMLIHFRIKTHGKIDLTSTQPIQINKHVAYIHNGVLSRTRIDHEASDTVVFKRDVLEHMPNGFYMREPFQILISSFIGEFNKLIFLDVKHRWVIFNEKKGYWDNGMWFSNDSFKKKWNQTNSQISNVYHGGNSTPKVGETKELFAHCPTRLTSPINITPKVADAGTLEIQPSEDEKPHIKWKFNCDFCDAKFLVGELLGVYNERQMACSVCKNKLKREGVNPVSEIQAILVHSKGF